MTIAKEEEDSVLRRFQRKFRERHLELAEPNLSKAREYADRLQPHAEDGRLYRAIALTEPCRRWKSGAPIDLSVFDRMGISIALYMRLVYWSIPLFGLLSVIALVPMIYNMTGSFVEANPLLTMHSLGNSPDLTACHGISDLLIVSIMCFALVRGTRKLREASDTLMPRRPSQLSAANYTLMVSGLPRTGEVQVRALRELFELWGEVITVSVSRANRALIKIVRNRNALHERIHAHNIKMIRATRKGNESKGQALVAARTRTRLKRELEAVNRRISELRAKPQPCTGKCFVTFNEQRAAHTCLQDLLSQPERELSRAPGFAPYAVMLRPEFAPPPDNIIWENLGYGGVSRFFRRLLVNCILLVQCVLSSAAITHVTNSNVEIALDEDAGFVLKTWTMAWTTGIVIASNILIFITAPIYMQSIEREHSHDKRETTLAGKLLAFQLFNGFAATLSFLWTKQQARADLINADGNATDWGTMGIFDREWYEVGGATVVNTLIADIFVINLLVEGVRFIDVLPARLIGCKQGFPWSPVTQQALNRRYAAKNPLYLPFRMQLLLKMWVLGCGFGYALPVMYPLTLVFCAISYYTDRSGLLRTFTGVLNVGDKLVMLLAMIDVCPWALVLHAFLSLLTAHHFELDRLGLALAIKDEDKTWLDHALVWSRHIRTTIQNGWVALAFVIFVLVFIFACCFVFNEKRLRRARKERLSSRFMRLPHVGSKAFKQLQRGVTGLGRKAGQMSRRRSSVTSVMKSPEPATLTCSASGSTISELEGAARGDLGAPMPHDPAAEMNTSSHTEGAGGPSSSACSDSADVDESADATSSLGETGSAADTDIMFDGATVNDRELEADLVPFRELHAHEGASVKLYIPPLTTLLLSAFGGERTGPLLRPSQLRDVAGDEIIVSSSGKRTPRRLGRSRLPRELDVLAITEPTDAQHKRSVSPRKRMSRYAGVRVSEDGDVPPQAPTPPAEEPAPETAESIRPCGSASSTIPVAVCGDVMGVCGDAVSSSPSVSQPALSEV